MESKTCTICGIKKPKTSDFFQPCARHRDGFEGRCRECKREVARRAVSRRSPERANEVRENIRRWQAENRDSLLESFREYHKSHSDEIRARKSEAYYKNREEILKKRKEYHARTKVSRNEKAKEYRRAQAVEIRTRSAERYRRRYGVDPHFTLSLRVRNLVRGSLKGKRKGSKTFDLLGYTVTELRDHIVSQFTGEMNIAALLRGEIHIDHIRPVASFNITSESCEDFKKCWALSNLQPLWAKDNLSKGASYRPPLVRHANCVIASPHHTL